ncbi:MAG: 30S ribosomal protein S20 [Gammaproteobacteria bacterium]|nr:30S ribosomal protein S20 [Gammaproteobacteria bacterium]
MANSPQAKKRARQAEKHRQHNQGAKTRLRTYIKNVLKSVDGGDKEKASEALKAAAPRIDGAVTKGLLHKNTAARYKSRLNARVRAMA